MIFSSQKSGRFDLERISLMRSFFCFSAGETQVVAYQFYFNHTRLVVNRSGTDAARDPSTGVAETTSDHGGTASGKRWENKQ